MHLGLRPTVTYGQSIFSKSNIVSFGCPATY